MPFVNQKLFDAISQIMSWTAIQTIGFFQKVQYESRVRPLSPEEQKIILELRRQKFRFTDIARALNRTPHFVAKQYLHRLGTSKKIDHTSQEAQKLEQLIKKHFKMFRLQKEARPFPRSILRKFAHGLRLDFYLPQLKIAFEYDGAQHNHFVKHFHKDKRTFLNAQKYDQTKNELCQQLGIHLLRFSSDQRVTEELFKRKLDAINWGMK